MKKDTQFWEEQMDLLAQQNHVVIDNFFQPHHLKLLYHFFEEKMEDAAFKPAAIGPLTNEKLEEEIRNDLIFWLAKEEHTELQPIFTVLSDLMQVLNRFLFLSLRDYEFHLAHYGKGSFYKKHLDQFRGRNNRLISIIIYLNPNWKKEDGGALKIYGNPHQKIEPLENRCVLFRSDVLYHEVLPTHQTRKSLTGWMLYETPFIPPVI